MTPILHKLHPPWVVVSLPQNIKYVGPTLKRSTLTTSSPASWSLSGSRRHRLNPKPRLLPLHPANVLCR